LIGELCFPLERFVLFRILAGHGARIMFMPETSLPVLDPTAAAIDVGSEQLHVSIAGGPPKIFGTTTGQLHEMRDWLQAQGARSVAMEATGVYWLCPYEVLEQAGFQVANTSRTCRAARPT
jgi:hypothetical protein